MRFLHCRSRISFFTIFFSLVLNLSPLVASYGDSEYSTQDGIRIGIQKAILGSGIRYPFVYLRTLKQTDAWEKTEPQPALDHLKEALRKGGVRQVYRGLGFFSSEMILRESYKYPLLMHYLPRFYDQILPQNSRGPLAYKLYSGCFLALLDTTIGCPFNHARNLLITSKVNKPVLQLFDEIEGTWRQKLYYGYSAKLARGIVYYSAFFTLDHTLKQQARKYKGSQKLTLFEMMALGGTVGTLTTFVVTPLEVLIVLLQKENAMPNEGLYKNMKRIYATGGLRIIYAGLTLHIFQRIFGSAISVCVLDHEEQRSIRKD